MMKMKISYPCPRCGNVILANRCEKCGYELLPETPRPKIEEPEKREKKKPKRLSPDKFLKA